MDDGKSLQEGRDFEPVADPLMGSKPWSGEFTTWRGDYSKLEEVAKILDANRF